MTRSAVAAIADPPAPDAVFARLAHLPYAIWLDSAADIAGTGRHSFIAADPFAILEADARGARWITPGDSEPIVGSAFGVLDEVLARMRTDGSSPLPFEGGAAGFISYEAAGEFERLPLPRDAGTGLPLVHLALFDVVCGWDHATGECHIVSTGRPEEGEAAERRAGERLAETRAWLEGGPVPRGWVPPPRRSEDSPCGSDGPPGHPVAGIPWLESTASEAGYVDAVERIIEAIRDGDVYQVNLSQRFTATTGAAPFDVYGELRKRSPAPYGAVVRVAGASVLSSSPERFLRVENGTVETRPIKGTRPRGSDAAEDARLAAELVDSEKDRAENLMIVDLLRNDLSRVCRPGTIEVPQLFGLESWATVHHLVSAVRGQLRDGVAASDLLRATFPCGSVTGAPKIRAMEIIADAEPVARGPYCGAIGYFGFGGCIDLSVGIRILALDANGRADFHAGGGVVFDSDPREEYRETMAKARAIIASLDASGRRGAREASP